MKRFVACLIICLITLPVRAESNPEVLPAAKAIVANLNQLTMKCSALCDSELIAKVCKKHLEIQLEKIDAPVVWEIGTSKHKECYILGVCIQPSFTVWSYAKNGVIKNQGVKVD